VQVTRSDVPFPGSTIFDRTSSVCYYGLVIALVISGKGTGIDVYRLHVLSPAGVFQTWVYTSNTFHALFTVALQKTDARGTGKPASSH